jgi:exodeoxyribonuclease VII small subunit
MAMKKIPKNIKFEDALKEMEEQVSRLESGELSLEESLEAYRYAAELKKICAAKLDLAKKEVEKIIVSDSDDGEYGLEKLAEVEE